MKGLSKNVDEKNLRDLFSKIGEVTDVCVMRTGSGKSRLFGFVGYRCSNEAIECVRYFNNTYMGSSRISVEIAKKIGSIELRKPRSVYTIGKGEGEKDGHHASKNMQVLPKPSNDSSKTVHSRHNGAIVQNSMNERKCLLQESSDDIDINDSVDQRDLSQWQQMACPSTVPIAEGGNRGDVVEDTKINSVMNRCGSFSDDFKDVLHATAGLYLKNLPYSCSEDEVYNHFSIFGNIDRVYIPLDSTRRSKGFGYVCFSLPESAERALNSLDGSSFQGRIINITRAREVNMEEKFQSTRNKDIKNSDFSSYLRKRENMKTKIWGEKSWNTSHVGSSAVVNTIANRFKVLPSDIMDTRKTASDVAIRLAVGEAKIVAENSVHLKEEGIDLTGKINSTKRSDTTLLIKNLSADSVSAELESLCSRYGGISRFILSSSKTVAVVEYLEPSDARSAFSGLTYRKYKHLPLYVEWAPLDISPGSMSNFEEISNPNPNLDSSTIDGVSPLSSTLSAKTIFVRNLNYVTTEDGIRHHLLHIGCKPESIVAISIPSKSQGNRGFGSSRGYGFIEFSSSTNIEKIVGSLHGSVLDGRSLDVQVSSKKYDVNSSASFNSNYDSSSTGSVQKTSCKLIVRNLAFQATCEEVSNIFSPFGCISNIRMPKKRGGVHRGFAFIDFSNREEACNALNALKDVHLYGRHLIIDWASETGVHDNDISGLSRKRNICY